jgi:hypothetical protein
MKTIGEFAFLQSDDGVKRHKTKHQHDGNWQNQEVPQKNSADYSASFRNLELRIRESNGVCSWSVTDAATGEVTGQGETADRVTAMVDAAQAAEADWGGVKWRGLEEDADS